MLPKPDKIIPAVLHLDQRTGNHKPYNGLNLSHLPDPLEHHFTLSAAAG